MENRARRRTTFFNWGVGWRGVGIAPNLSLAPLLDLHLHLHVTLSDLHLHWHVTLLDLYLAFDIKGWGGVGIIPNLSLAPLLDLHLHLHVMLSDLHLRWHVTLLDLYLAFDMKGWGGVGWGGDNTKPVCSATRSSLALTCYAIRSSLAFTCYAIRSIRSSLALTCYATWSLLGFWHEGVGWGGVGIIPNPSLAHTGKAFLAVTGKALSRRLKSWKRKKKERASTFWSNENIVKTMWSAEWTLILPGKI